MRGGVSLFIFVDLLLSAGVENWNTCVGSTSGCFCVSKKGRKKGGKKVEGKKGLKDAKCK